MNAPRTTSGKAPWIICLLLLLAALGVFGYVLYSTWASHDGMSATQSAFNPDEKAELDSVENGNRTLEETLAALKALLEAEPCDIPVSTNGVSLLPAEISEQQASVPVTSGPSKGSASRNGTGELRPLSAGPDSVEAATVLVVVNGGESLGTGFFVAPDILVTNRHVVAGAKQPTVLINAYMGSRKAAVIAVSDGSDRDYAILRVEGGNSPAPLPLCDVRKTEKVSAWGFPDVVSYADPQYQAILLGDLSAVPEGVYSEGVVNVVRNTTPQMVLHTAVISSGNSGGPLVNAEGCVVGINTSIEFDDESYRQTSVALASRDLAAFLEQNGITPQYRSEAQVKP